MYLSIYLSIYPCKYIYMYINNIYIIYINCIMSVMLSLTTVWSQYYITTFQIIKFMHLDQTKT